MRTRPRKNIKKRENELRQQSSGQRCYVNRELWKGCAGCLLCCCNCYGSLNTEGLEFCPTCKELIQHNKGCSSVYHKKCKKVFIRGSQCSIPCGCCATGCYIPGFGGCCYYAHDERGNHVTCNTCISCWCCIAI